MRREKSRFKARFDKVQQAEATEKVVNLEGSLYALLFDSYPKQNSPDSQLVYDLLIKSGVEKPKILFLKGEGDRETGRLPATITSLELAVASLRQKVMPNDRLLFYFSGDGNVADGEYYFESYNEPSHDERRPYHGLIWETDFTEMMQSLPVNFSLFYFSQCYAGKLAKIMGYGRNIIISTANKKEKSWFDDETGDNFTNDFFSVVLKNNVTIEQAFDEMVKKTIPFFTWRRVRNLHDTETPQLRRQNADPAQLYLGPISSK